MKVNQWKVGEKYLKSSHGCYFCKIVHPNGRREDRRLDPDKDKAEQIRCELVTALKRQGTPGPDYLVRDLIFLFLDHSKVNNAPTTYRLHRHFLKSFCDTIPASLRVSDLRLHHAQNWLNLRYPATGNQNTRHDAIASLKRVFNWAVNDMDYLDTSPLAKLKKPPKVPRRTFVTKEQWDTVFAQYKANDPFRDFLRFMLLTGCRPQEAKVIEARHVDWKAMRAHFEEGEVPGKKGSRDILLTEEAFAILKKNAERFPTGPLLRNKQGNPWKKSSINCRFTRLRKKVPFKVHAYLARHSTATEMLEAGASSGAVAAVLGHKDATMVLRVYGKHIDEREQHLRECLKRATS
jgi:integrase